VNAPSPPPARAAAQRIAAGWFLGFLFVVVAIVAWLRGAGRIVLPLLLAGLVAAAVVRFVRKVMEPLP
jgi:hypothetical protein